MSNEAWKWATPLLAAITFLLDGGHLVGLIKPEILVLIAAGITAIVGFLAAIRHPEEAQPQVQQLHPPQQAPNVAQQQKK